MQKLFPLTSGVQKKLKISKLVRKLKNFQSKESLKLTLMLGSDHTFELPTTGIVNLKKMYK